MIWSFIIIAILLCIQGNKHRMVAAQWKNTRQVNRLGKVLNILHRNLKGLFHRFAIIEINLPAISLLLVFGFVSFAVNLLLGIFPHAQSGDFPSICPCQENESTQIVHLMHKQNKSFSIYGARVSEFSVIFPTPSHYTSTLKSVFFHSSMEKELEDLWSKISLNELEEKQVEIKGSQATLSNRLLLGRFIGRKIISLQQLTYLLKKSWPVSTHKAAQAGDDMYLFELPSREACLKVYKDQPWHIGGVLLAVRIVADQENFEDMQVTKVPFWVQIHVYQFFNITKENGRLIAQTVGEVIEVDVDKQSIAWGKFMRVRVLIDTGKPLCRWGHSVINGKKLLVIFRFEKIVEYCFGCGYIDHMLRECPLRFNPNGSTKKVAYKYPIWLRAEGFAGVAFEDLKRFLETSRYMVETLEKGKEKATDNQITKVQGSRLLLEGAQHQGQGSQVDSSEQKVEEDKAPMEVENTIGTEAKESEIPTQKRSRVNEGGEKSSGMSHAHGGYMGFAPYKARKREQVTTFRDLKVTKKRSAGDQQQTARAKYRKIAPRPANLSMQHYQMMSYQQHSLQNYYPQPHMHYPPEEQFQDYPNMYGENPAGMIGPIAAELWDITKQALQMGQVEWNQSMLGVPQMGEFENRDKRVRIEPLEAEEGWARGGGPSQNMGSSDGSVGWGGGVGPGH